ncbi:MAG TPA: T9SS type A sorting domain-containing protein, partial [Chryseolinea sp.]|nr:T9SS type A sorting domain-containing protein [Chryseolinea sp.]
QDMIYYWVTAFDTQNNSSAFSDVASIVITASENQGVDPIVMYPNPVNDFLEVKTPYTQSVFVFFDMQGRQMKQGNVPENGIIDIHDLASGSYRCKITSKHQAFVFSIIKK